MLLLVVLTDSVDCGALNLNQSAKQALISVGGVRMADRRNGAGIADGSSVIHSLSSEKGIVFH